MLNFDGSTDPVPVITQVLKQRGFAIRAGVVDDIVAGTKGNVSMNVTRPPMEGGKPLLVIQFITPFVNVPNDVADSYLKKGTEPLDLP